MLAVFTDGNNVDLLSALSCSSASLPETVTACCSDRECAITGSFDGTVTLMGTEGVVWSARCSNYCIVSVVLCTFGVVIGSLDGTITSLCLTDGQVLDEYTIVDTQVSDVCANKNTVVVACDQGIRVLDLQESGKLVFRFSSSHKSAMKSVSFAGDNYLFSGDASGRICKWEFVGLEASLISSEKAHGDWVSSLHTIDGIKLASCSFDGSMKVWNTVSMECVATFSQNEELIDVLLSDTSKSVIYAASNENTVYVYDIAASECTGKLISDNRIKCIALLIDSKLKIDPITRAKFTGGGRVSIAKRISSKVKDRLSNLRYSGRSTGVSL